MNRRTFINTTAAYGVSALLSRAAFAARFSPGYFRQHPFITAHPEAVFIKFTSIASMDDTAGRLAAGQSFLQDIFSPADTPDGSLTNKIVIKPNLTYTYGTGTSAVGSGIVTDRYFMEGFLTGLKGIGFDSGNLYLREGNMLADGYCAQDYSLTGYPEMAQRLGVNLADFPTRKIPLAASDSLQEGTEVIWKSCPQGVVLSRFGYIAPIHDPAFSLINIAKLKSHPMGMTLCSKNLQGSCVYPYIRFCNNFDEIQSYPAAVLADIQPDLRTRITAMHAAHVAAGIPRWDRPGQDFTCGLGMELWSQRTCDSLSVTKPAISIIEGIYGRNGNGFAGGPGSNGTPEDFLTNVIIFGANPVLVDIVGTWLAGHEPGNFGFFHIAMERGLTPTINPHTVPLYRWESNGPSLIELSSLQQTPLVTTYLRRDYSGQTEAEYHLVNEPYVYSAVINPKSTERPRISVLGNIRRSRGNAVVIEYTVSRPGPLRLEVFSAAGERIDVIAETYTLPGSHSVMWNYGVRPAGNYYCRLSGPGFTEAAPLMIGR
jgi:uncharacterized protein (DUF362 family)